MLIVAYVPIAWIRSTSSTTLEAGPARVHGLGVHLERPLRRRRAAAGIALTRPAIDDGREARGVAGVDDILDRGERLVDPVGVERLALRDQDLLRRGGLRPLARIEQLLVDLLARPPAHDLDRDLLVRLVAREPDHVAGQVDD